LVFMQLRSGKVIGEESESETGLGGYFRNDTCISLRLDLSSTGLG
ncbi:unnamed protein product, partial [Cuscuta campestris]